MSEHFVRFSNIPKDILELANKLSKLAKLKIRYFPEVIINTRSAPSQLIGQLLRRRYIPSYQKAPEDLKWLVEGEDNCPLDKTIHVIDLLGTYRSNENKIILYDLLIQLCSCKSGIDYDILKHIVLTHELAHAITHSGEDISGNTWKYFDVAPVEHKEYFAQMYTCKLLEKENNIPALMAMDRLSEIQGEDYNTYKTAIDTNISKVNLHLLATRKIVPSGDWEYQQAKSIDWKISFNNLERVREPFLDYWNPPTTPTPPGRIVAKGTAFTISLGKIIINSYDYSPPSDQFSIQSSFRACELINDNLAEIITAAKTNPLETPVFCFTVFGKEYFLNVSDLPVRDLFKRVVEVIGLDYPVLADILTQYEQEF